MVAGKKVKSKARIVVETKHDRTDVRGVTYQRELVLCGKKGCRKRHGPYWYAYWTAGGRTRTRYVGKEWRPLDVVEAGAVLGNRARRRRRGLHKTARRRGPPTASKPPPGGSRRELGAERQ